LRLSARWPSGNQEGHANSKQQAALSYAIDRLTRMWIVLIPGFVLTLANGVITQTVDPGRSRDAPDHEYPWGAFWGNLFGLAQTGSYRSENENVDEDIYEIGEGNAKVELDLMQPIDPNKSPKVHEPALNHIGLWVDDLKAAVAWLTEQGVRFTPGGIRRGAAGHEVCFIHPKGNSDAPVGGSGVLIELVQAPQRL